MRGIEGAVFRTITSEDWRRSIVEARAARNGVREQIAQKILDLKLGKSESGTGGKFNTEPQ